MNKSDLILAAIEQLGRSLSGKIDDVHAELKTDINGVRAELKADVARLETKIDHLETKMDHLETRFDRLETEVRTESRVIHACLDEKRQTVNALIPSRIAAVGRGTDAAE